MEMPLTTLCLYRRSWAFPFKGDAFVHIVYVTAILDLSIQRRCQAIAIVHANWNGNLNMGALLSMHFLPTILNHPTVPDPLHATYSTISKHIYMVGERGRTLATFSARLWWACTSCKFNGRGRGIYLHRQCVLCCWMMKRLKEAALNQEELACLV